MWPNSNTREYGHIEKVLRGQDPRLQQVQERADTRAVLQGRGHLLKAKRKYSGRAQQASPEETTEDEDNLPSLIELHYEDDNEGVGEDEAKPSAEEWRVGTVILTDPDGNEMTINCSNTAALGSLLTKLSQCHA